MNIKILIAAVLIYAELAFAQEKTYQPAESVGDSIEVDGNKVTAPEDKGAWLSAAIAKLEEALLRLPEDTTGKAHPDHATILMILQKAKAWDDSDRFVDMCEMFKPVEAFFYSENRETLNSDVSAAIFAILDGMRREPSVQATSYIKQNADHPDQRLMEMMIHAYVTPPLCLGDSDWDFIDDDTVDEAGLFVLNPAQATAVLKSMKLDRIKTFLSGHTDNSFFERYEETGDGLPVLKMKYAINKEAIQAKFAEVLDHAAFLGGQLK